MNQKTILQSKMSVVSVGYFQFLIQIQIFYDRHEQSAGTPFDNPASCSLISAGLIHSYYVLD